MSNETVDHPSHYGGKDNTYEAIKVIEAHNLGFHLGNALKYILRTGKKPGVDPIEDLKKARWYIDRQIQQLTPTNNSRDTVRSLVEASPLVPIPPILGRYTPKGPFKMEEVKGDFRISDSNDSRIATCYLIENAEFVTKALNEYRPEVHKEDL